MKVHINLINIKFASYQRDKKMLSFGRYQCLTMLTTIFIDRVINLIHHSIKHMQLTQV